MQIVALKLMVTDHQTNNTHQSNLHQTDPADTNNPLEKLSLTSECFFTHARKYILHEQTHNTRPTKHASTKHQNKT